MSTTKKKTPRPGGVINTESNKNRNESVSTSLLEKDQDFHTKFIVSTGSARVFVQPQALTGGGVAVELTDDHDSNILLTPAEALSIAAALQAVAVHLMEQECEHNVYK